MDYLRVDLSSKGSFYSQVNDHDLMGLQWWTEQQQLDQVNTQHQQFSDDHTDNIQQQNNAQNQNQNQDQNQQQIEEQEQILGEQDQNEQQIQENVDQQINQDQQIEVEQPPIVYPNVCDEKYSGVSGKKVYRFINNLNQGQTIFGYQTSN